MATVSYHCFGKSCRYDHIRPAWPSLPCDVAENQIIKCSNYCLQYTHVNKHTHQNTVYINTTPQYTSNIFQHYSSSNSVPSIYDTQFSGVEFIVRLRWPIIIFLILPFAIWFCPRHLNDVLFTKYRQGVNQNAIYLIEIEISHCIPHIPCVLPTAIF